ncbi:MAG: hypothetical protein HYW52_10930 [Gemmatimonadetes bacterium]|nr:hypothetical protein [Gemmatimonadota bacterium]
MLDAPSYEEAVWEASRDLVNLVPAVTHLARSRIRRIRRSVSHDAVVHERKEVAGLAVVFGAEP